MREVISQPRLLRARVSMCGDRFAAEPGHSRNWLHGGHWPKVDTGKNASAASKVTRRSDGRRVCVKLASWRKEGVVDADAGGQQRHDQNRWEDEGAERDDEHYWQGLCVFLGAVLWEMSAIVMLTQCHRLHLRDF